MKVPTARAEAFTKAPPDEIRAILIYGPDLGLVRERAEAAATAVAGSLSDPFKVAEFTTAALKDEPSRLTDEAQAISMMGGRRVVRLRDATDSVAKVVTDTLAATKKSGDSALVIIEAGDLSPRSKLRALFEKTDGAAVIACYLDEGAGLDDLVRKSLADAGLKASGRVVSWIAGNLGSDRMVSRMELEKLTLYVAGQSEIMLEDAQAVIGDATAVTLDDVVYAATGGDLIGLTVAAARARFEGIASISILRAASRHVSRLEEAVAAMNGGTDADSAMKKLRPPVFFKQQKSFRNQLQRWRPQSLRRARTELIQAEIDCKTTGMPDEAICERALMRLAAMAGARVPR
ncbi:MAG: DNA polymerase III subunit delta [Rhodospirillaceae bacterium]|nr:DNA polymerase III subunit delta [Rhodospirillaceae bacterium]